MKKAFAFFLILSLLLSFSACTNAPPEEYEPYIPRPVPTESNSTETTEATAATDPPAITEPVIDTDPDWDIEITSSEEIYALGRVLQNPKIKQNYINKDSTYNIRQDLDLFSYPDGTNSNADKITYLQTASYKLTADIELTLAKVQGRQYFTGIGCSILPFMGTFNGNGKTITIKTNGTFDFSDVSDYGTGLFDTTENAKICNLNITVKDDILLTAAVGVAHIGIVVGNATGTVVANCTVSVAGSVVGAAFKHLDVPLHIGGIVGYASLSTFQNCHVVLKNSSFKGAGETIFPTRNYGAISIGGIIGFSSAGSSNEDEYIGRLGNQLYRCNFTAQNDSPQDTILATVKTGDELAVGGIVGCTFNNLLIQSCHVKVQNGSISAIKTGETDVENYGTQAAGIIGRMEHTGEVTHCSVTGEHLTILSKCPNNVASAGGLVGIDMGAYHRDIDSINNSIFDGSGTSQIRLEITSSEDLERDRIIGAGGIVGVGTYTMANCSVKNVTISNHSAGIENSSYIGELAGFFVLSKPASFPVGIGINWTYKKYFKPRQSGFYNCTAENVTIEKTDNVQNLSYRNNS